MQNEKFSFVCLNPDLVHSKRNSNCEFQVPTSEEKEFQNLKHYMWGLHPYGKTPSISHIDTKSLDNRTMHAREVQKKSIF